MIDTETIKTEAQIRKAQLEQFLGECAQLLTLPSTCDKSDILTAIKRQILDVEEKNRELEKRLDKEQQEHDREVNNLLDEVKNLKVALDKQENENATLRVRVEKLETGVKLVIEEKQKTITWLERITGTIRKITLVETHRK